MSTPIGTMVFARYDSSRLPGKALRPIGGMPLLERVIRRSKLLSWPVYLATTPKPSDDPLCALAESLGVPVFRGPAERVLERAVLAAEAFELQTFVRLCGDRPLFPLERLREAVAVVHSGEMPDLVTDYVPGKTVRGLTTEVVRTKTLRRIQDRDVTDDQQEHLTKYFYDHPDEFRITYLPLPEVSYRCPGFAVDTEADLIALDGIFADDRSIDMSVAEADRRYRP